jgi:hypothetical protein
MSEKRGSLNVVLRGEERTTTLRMILIAANLWEGKQP